MNQAKYLVQRRSCTGGGSSYGRRYNSWTAWTTLDRQDSLEAARQQIEILKKRGGLDEYRVTFKGEVQ
jgi:hypothetical protein